MIQTIGSKQAGDHTAVRLDTPGHDLMDDRAHGTVSRLPGLIAGQSLLPEFFHQQTDLRALAGTVNALKGEKISFFHGQFSSSTTVHFSIP